MELKNQIRIRRQQLGFSQEELASRIYVSRNTISNWETERSYPDIQSLMRLSAAFGVSVDELIKGDISEMEEKIEESKVRSFNRVSVIFACLFIGVMIAFIPLYKFLGNTGLIIWAVLYFITLGVSLYVEKLKKENNIHTYKEIVAFSNGQTLNEVEKKVEQGKHPYQVFLMCMVGAAIGAVIVMIALLLP